MTDIEFDQIREGQTVRLHLNGGGHIEGPVTDPDGMVGVVAIGRSKFGCSLFTRIELLSEPAPTWKVGQLAEIDAAYSDDNKTTGRLVVWGEPAGSFFKGHRWIALDEIDSVWDDSKVTRRVLLKAVPADARVVSQDAVVLPPLDPATGSPWDLRMIRALANTRVRGVPVNTATRYRALADAIEEAQR